MTKNDIAIARALLNEAQIAIGNWVDWLETHPTPEVWAAGLDEATGDEFVADIFALAANNCPNRAEGMIKDYLPIRLGGYIRGLTDAVMPSKATLLANAVKNAQTVHLAFFGGKDYLTGTLSVERWIGTHLYYFTSNEGSPSVHFTPKDVSDALVDHDGHLFVRL
jgi:hypothetical protein